MAFLWLYLYLYIQVYFYIDLEEEKKRKEMRVMNWFGQKWWCSNASIELIFPVALNQLSWNQWWRPNAILGIPGPSSPFLPLPLPPRSLPAESIQPVDCIDPRHTFSARFNVERREAPTFIQKSINQSVVNKTKNKDDNQIEREERDSSYARGSSASQREQD